jgi:WD40 repeat protein
MFEFKIKTTSFSVVLFILIMEAAFLMPGLYATDTGPKELEQVLQDADKLQLAYSPDKKRLAHLSGYWVRVWSLPEKRLLHQFPLEGVPQAVAFNPDGGSVVTANGVGNLEYLSTIRVWPLDATKGRVIAKCLGSVTDLSFSEDGSLAAATKLSFLGSITRSSITEDDIQQGGHIHVWRLSDGRELMKVNIELPDYSAKLRALRAAQSGDPESKDDTALVDTLQTAYRNAVREHVPVRLYFNSEGKQLVGVSESGRETIIECKAVQPKP